MCTGNAIKALLILDLDETLIHSSLIELEGLCDLKIFNFYVYKRPHLDEFLKEAFKYYKIGIWSTGSDDYVEAIVKHLIPEGEHLEFVWGRSRCPVKMPGENDYVHAGYAHYIKPVQKVTRKGYKKERILIVDDSPYKISENYGNAIYIDEFTGDKNDDALIRLAKYLKEIHDVTNFRSIEKRGWYEAGKKINR